MVKYSIFCIYLTFISASFEIVDVHEEEYGLTPELIKNQGYYHEIYDVKTDDGYILEIFRIPYDRFVSQLYLESNEIFSKDFDDVFSYIIGYTKLFIKKPVVLLQHGLLDSSTSWVVNQANQSLAFVLADAGMDVWLGNMRGNSYGSRNQKYKPTNGAFWHFTWDDMGYDLQAIINHILKVTGEQQLIYIGHSQACLIGFKQFSVDKALASKIKLFIGLTPFIKLSSMNSPLKMIFTNIEIPTKEAFNEFWYSILGRKELKIKTLMSKLGMNKLIDSNNVNSSMSYLISIIAGQTTSLNISRMPLYFKEYPQATSVKNVIHLIQIEPIQYDVTNMDVPTALFYGGNDLLITEKDVKHLKSNLKNVVYEKLINDWNHGDFVWAINGKERLHDDIIKLIKNT